MSSAEGLNGRRDGPAAVEMRNVSKSFGQTSVLEDVCFGVGGGEFVTLLGPSGCGKTTSLRILAGFEEPNSGEVMVEGRPVTGLPPWRRNIGIVFQTYALFPYLSARDNVAFGLKMRRVSRAEIDSRVEAALRMVGLEGYGDRYPRQLSGGQRQRVALARALVIEPQLLLLDEPLSNLDAKLRTEMRYELKRIQRESGVTTVFVTHDQEEAFSLSDRIVLMNKGVIKQSGTPRELWEKPNSAFVADFIGVENLMPGTVEAGDGGLLVRLSEGLAVRPAEMRFAPGDRVIVGLRAQDVALRPASEARQEAPAEMRFAPGDRVIVGLRAQDVALRPASEARQEAPGAVRARVADVEYRGESCAYRLVSDDLPYPLTALAPSRDRHGTEVVAEFDAARLMVLEDDR